MILQDLFSGFCATFGMTGFSYILARIKDDNFREPELLNILLFTKIKRFRSKRRHLAGWIMHFLIGVALMSLFNALWHFAIIPPLYSYTMIMGVCAGILACVGWHMLFKLSSPDPPVALKHFYLQLIFAHILFSIVGLAVHQLWFLYGF